APCHQGAAPAGRSSRAVGLAGQGRAMAREGSRSRSPPSRSALAGQVEAFLRGCPDVEERAKAQMRDAPAEVQQAVLRRGGLNDARNPTAVLISRIRNAAE
ncbi:unnamed protein product, partial [Prorocentrum cordatum]